MDNTGLQTEDLTGQNPAITPIAAGQTTAAPASGPVSAPSGSPPAHARLMSMIQGLALGADAFGKAIATKGREGGVGEVIQADEAKQQMEQRQQQMAIQKRQAQTAEEEAQGRILYNRALTNHSVLQNQILLQTAPLEIQQLELKNQTDLLELYEKAGLSPMAAVAMVQGQAAQSHLDAVKEKVGGDLVNNTAIPVHDGTPGAGGTTNIFSYDSMSRLSFKQDQLAPIFANEHNLIEMAKAKLGADDPAIKQAETQLELAKTAPEMNGEDFFRHNIGLVATLNQATARYDANQKATEQRAETAQKVQAADPVAQLSKPEELSKPGAVQAIQAKIADPNTKPQDIPRLRALIPRAQLAIQAEARQKQADEQAKQIIDQGDPNQAGALLANRTLTLPDLKSRQVTPQFIASAVKVAQKIDPNFKAPEAEAQATIARSAQNQQFFGNTDSLLVKGGTLDQLTMAAKNLPTGQIPVFNKVSNLVSQAAGQGPTAAYAASILGVADDYAKVMGGSIGTDTARKVIMDRLDAAQSPEQKSAVVDQFRQQIRSQREGRIGTNQYLRDLYPNPEAQGGGTAPIYASAPGKPRLVSNDGGKTWQTAPGQ